MPFNCNLLECFPIVSSSLFFYNTINSKRNTTMRHHSFSTFTPLIVAAIALFAGKLSVQASIFSFENERRGLIAKNSNNDISLTSDDDDSTGAPETIKKKGSIASRTSSVASTKKSSLMGPGEMGVQFVKPETAAPSVVPPTTKKDSTTKSSQSISSNSTSTSSSTPAANKTVSSPSTSPKTFYPTSAGVDSIASRTSNTADSTKVPISASMEFDKAETASPSLIQHTSNDGINSPKNTSSASIEDSDTQGTLCRMISQTKGTKILIVPCLCVYHKKSIIMS